MIVVLALLAVFASQAFTLGRAWLGAQAPDLLVLLVAFTALRVRRRGLRLGTAVFVGWSRALVLLEPAGGQILCACTAMAVVSGLRSQVEAGTRLGFVVSAALVAGSWDLMASLVSTVFETAPLGGPELWWGAALSVPLAGLASRLGRQVERNT